MVPERAAHSSDSTVQRSGLRLPRLTRRYRRLQLQHVQRQLSASATLSAVAPVVPDCASAGQRCGPPRCQTVVPAVAVSCPHRSIEIIKLYTIVLEYYDNLVFQDKDQ